MNASSGLLVLAAVGALFAVVGAVFATSGRRRGRTPDRTGWLRTDGTIVDHRPGPWLGPSTDASRLLYPVVRYRGPDGIDREFVNPTTIDTGLYRTGVVRPVLVDPADPARAELANSNAVRRAVGCGHLVLGTLFCVLGLLLIATAAVAHLLTR